MKKVVLAVAGIMFIAGAAQAQSVSVETRMARESFRGLMIKPATRLEQKKGNSLEQYIERKVKQAQTVKQPKAVSQPKKVVNQPKKEEKKAPAQKQQVSPKSPAPQKLIRPSRKEVHLAMLSEASTQPFK